VREVANELDVAEMEAGDLRKDVGVGFLRKKRGGSLSAKER